MSKNLIIFLFLIAFSCTLLYTVYEGWYSYFLLWISSYCIGYQYLRVRHVQYKNEILPIFTFAFSIYSIYMYVTNLIYVKDPSVDFFMMVDSMKFWDNSNFKMNHLRDFYNRIGEMAIITARYRLFNIQSISLAYFAQAIDENNILIQKLPSVFLGAFSMPYIFLMLKRFVGKVNAYKYAMFFVFFSFVCIYSVVFNRDPQVYFLYTLGAYLVVYYKEKTNVPIKLVFLMLITMGFRFEHGLFFSLYIILYYYLKNSNKLEGKFLLITFLIAFSVFALPFIVSKFADTTDAYETQRQNIERKEVSLGAKFANLPIGVKQVLLMVNGQIAPAVPFWRGWYIDNFNAVNIKFNQPGYFTPWRFMESIAAITWIYIWAFIVVGIKSNFKTLSIEIKGLFLFALLLLLATTSSIDVRRMYCVYPIIFIVSMLIYDKMQFGLRKKIISRTSIALLAIYLMYFIIK